MQSSKTILMRISFNGELITDTVIILLHLFIYILLRILFGGELI